MSKSFKFNVKVYYEDTDAGGVVYYANYLKFLERARSEVIYKLGYSNIDLKKKFGILIIVKSCNIEYKRPALLEDNLTIISSIDKISRTSFSMKQNIKRDEEIIAISNIHLVSVNLDGKPIKIPDKLNNLLRKFIN